MNNRRNLPIKSFCKTGSGGTPSRQKIDRYYENGVIPWVKSGELRESVILDTEEKITDLALKETSVKMVPKGALLVAMYGATIGRIATLGVDATTNQAVCHIIPDINIADPRYLFYALSNQVPTWINQGVGGAQPNISQQIIKETKVPLPPIAEQKRIAAILDKADAVRRKRRKAIRLTEELLRSTFLEMFGDPITNPKGWSSGTLLDIVNDRKTGLRCGPFGTQLKSSEIRDHGIPLLGIDNVKGGQFDSRFSKFMSSEKAEELKAFDVKPFDVLVTRMGTVGHACLVPENIPDSRISYHLFRIRVDREKCLPDFLAATITHSGTFLNQLKQRAHGAIMDGLKTSDLKEINFLIPPIEEQKAYVKLVDRLQKYDHRSQSSILESESLFNSLLQRAFTGNL